MKKEWTKIGKIDVASGLCWIGDPCYIFKDNKTDMKTWSDFEDGLSGDGKPYSQCDESICTCAGWGDGYYDVEARILDNYVHEIRIVFIQ